MSARATPASSPEGAESFGPCSTTSADKAVTLSAKAARTAAARPTRNPGLLTLIS